MIKDFFIELSSEITTALKLLFETKHLYQFVNVDVDSARAKLGHVNTLTESSSLSEDIIKQAIDRYWETNSSEVERIGSSDGGVAEVTLRGAKLFCKPCDRNEAFNFVHSEDLLRSSKNYKNESGRTVQIFAFSLQCHSCISIPEVFIVRREGTKLILSGRSPMQSINVPKDIPKSIKEYYTGALLAFQSGQTLPANFMLRVLIEQWTRQVTQEPTTREIDTVIDKYMKSLPGDFTERFYSFRKLYEELSVDIHGATGSVELFEKAFSEINTHFEARRLFKLSQ